MSGFMRFIKRQYFWLLVPVLVLVMAAAWFMATSEVIATFEKDSSTIDGYFSSMAQVQGVSPHPNEDFDRGMKGYISQRATDVDIAWQTNYEKQVGTMKWSPLLTKDFIQIVDDLRPIEAVTEEVPGTVVIRGTKREIQPWVGNMYRDFIIEKESFSERLVQ